MTPQEQLMQLVAGGAGKQAIPQRGAAPPQVQSPSAPVGSPMSTPQPQEGEKQNAMLQIQMAMDILENTIAPLGSETPEGATILSVLSKLSSKFGAHRAGAKELIPSEVMQLVQGLPQAGGMSPQMKAMMGAGAGGQPPMQ